MRECGPYAFYNAEAERNRSTHHNFVARPAATEATTITVPLTKLEVEYYLEHSTETVGHRYGYLLFDGVMDAIRQDLDPHVVWFDKDHINKEATMKRLKENWGSDIRRHVATRQKYIERATDALRKEHGEQIATLQSMVADLLEENARQKKEDAARIAALETTVSDLTARLFPLESVKTSEVPSRLLGRVITATPRNISGPQPACSIIAPLPPSPPSSRTSSVAKEAPPVPLAINRNDRYAQQASRLREARRDRELTALARAFYN